jgi:putative transposase
MYHVTMLIRRAYKFQLKTNTRQVEQLSRFAGCCRLVWNKALALQKEKLDQKIKVLAYVECAAELVAWKTELKFLEEVHSQPLQQTLKDLDRAIKEAFKGTKGFPKFKKKGQQDSFRYPQGIKVSNDQIYLPKIGWFKFRKSREIEGLIKNAIVSRSAGKWYVSIQAEREVAQPVHPAKSAIGIDMGVRKFAVMSDGAVLESINSFKKWEVKLSHELRKLSRKTKFSSNWRKQKAKIQRIHSTIVHVRNDFLHKSTSSISKNHAIVVLEHLKVSNMSRSAKGTVEEPGTNVAAKAGLNKSILDQGWYEFRRQLTYKEQWLGGNVILINPANTSQACSKCNHIAAENRYSQAQFKCVSCGYCENADLNAAKNILAAGRAVLACGGIRQNAA